MTVTVSENVLSCSWQQDIMNRGVWISDKNKLFDVSATDSKWSADLYKK